MRRGTWLRMGGRRDFKIKQERQATRIWFVCVFIFKNLQQSTCFMCHGCIFTFWDIKYPVAVEKVSERSFMKIKVIQRGKLKFFTQLGSSRLNQVPALWSPCECWRKLSREPLRHLLQPRHFSQLPKGHFWSFLLCFLSWRNIESTQVEKLLLLFKRQPSDQLLVMMRCHLDT